MENRVTVNIDKIIKAKMIETNTIVEVVFYPHTPVGSYIIYHWDIDGALDGALSVFEEQTDA